MNTCKHTPTAHKPRQLNADYRWTMPKVTAFLDALAACGNVAEAARAVGMSRQSAYRLRARLAGTRFAGAFEGARRQGIRARAAASRERLRSRWDGPGLGEIVRLCAVRDGAVQVDGRPPQGDAAPVQGYRAVPQGDVSTRKETRTPLDSVTTVTCSRAAHPIQRPGMQRPGTPPCGGRCIGHETKYRDARYGAIFDRLLSGACRSSFAGRFPVACRRPREHRSASVDAPNRCRHGCPLG